MKRNTVIQLIIIIILLIAIFIGSAILYFFPVRSEACELSIDEVSLHLGDKVSNSYKTYFADYESDKTFPDSLLQFEKTGDYIVEIPCGLKKYSILFHVVDEHVLLESEKEELERENRELAKLNKDQLLSELMEYMNEKQLSDENFAVAYENLITGETFFINPDKMMFAASTYKLPLAMYYYDEIEAGRRTLEDYLLYGENSFDAEEPLNNIYPLGSYIRTGDLIYNSLVYSDNTSSLILFNDLGGFDVFKEAIKKYSDTEYTQEFVYNNEFSVRYLNDVLKHLYQNKEKYQDIIDYMSLVYPEDYLRRYVPVEAIQKYGEYGPVQNSTGIVYTNEPYAITVMCDTPYNGIEVIGKVSEFLYQYNLKTTK